MTCQDFLEGYSEYLDERLGREDVRRWRDHIEACSSCARYDAVLRRGLQLVREMPVTEPSSDFHAGLRFRLRRAAVSDAARGSRSSVAGAGVPLAIAAVIAALAWSPLLRPIASPDAASLARTDHAAPPLSDPGTEVAAATASAPGPGQGETGGTAGDADVAGEASRTPFGSALTLGARSGTEEGEATRIPEPRIAAGPPVAPVWIEPAPSRPRVAAVGGALSGRRDAVEVRAATAGVVLDWPIAPVQSLSRRSLWPEPERVVPTLWDGPTPLEIWRRSSSTWSIRPGPAARPLLLESPSRPERGSLRLP